MKYPGFIGKSYLAARRTLGEDETVNLYLDSTPAGPCFRKVPGFATPSEISGISHPEIPNPVRGIFWLNGYTYAVIGDTVYYLKDDTQVSGVVGTIADDGLPVTFAASRSQLVIGSAKKAYLVTLPTTLAGQITWFAADIAAVAIVNTYFLFLADAGNGFFFSEPGDANTGTALNFASEETHASKFRMIHVIANEPWLFGDLAIQPFHQTLDPARPFLPNLSAAIPIGSAAKFGSVDIQGTPCWIGQCEEGGFAAYIAEGYAARRVSTLGVEDRFPVNVADARSYAVFLKGHLFWRIWFPGADQSWQFDIGMGDWTKIAGWNPGTGLPEAHEGSCATMNTARGLVLLGSRKNGAIFVLSPDYLDHNGERIHWLRRGPAIFNESERLVHPGFELAIEAGVGTASSGIPETDPQVDLRYSQDGGKTWSATLSRSMGQSADYLRRLIWWRLGSAYRRSIEVSGSASVAVTLHEAILKKPGTAA